MGARTEPIRDLAGDLSHVRARQIALISPQQQEKLSPCQMNCPSGTDIRGWIAFIAQRSKLGLSTEQAYTRAWQRLVEFNPLPAVLGRVCPHPCENQCNRGAKDEVVSIHMLERHIGDWALAHNLPLPQLVGKVNDASIGVVGAGPAGLSFAYQMARRGYAVTIYERLSQPGGMLRYGIPEYRLPRAILDGEIQRIIELGVELRLDCAVGKDISVDELRRRHVALFVGIGASHPLLLDIPGEQGPGVLSGTGFMACINQHQPVEVGKRVVVVGGGNTAIDAARAALRLGAEVTMLYRRTRQEMPAMAEEIDDAMAEGVDIQFLAAPLEILRECGCVVGIRVQKMALGEPDASGRRTPRPVPGDTCVLPATTIIAAISQQPDWRGLEALITAAGTIRPDGGGQIADGLWAGGDVAGLGTVTSAIGDGRRAAEDLHAQLTGEQLPAPKQLEVITAASMHLSFYAPGERVRAETITMASRYSEPSAEIQCGLGEEQFLAEIGRCLSCGSCLGCGNCWMYCNAHSYEQSKAPKPGDYFIFNQASCEGCSKCIEVCPCGFLSKSK
ncbi:MAG TPA: NAD(P)-binding protein [Gammaproteobacteria bacterium]